jgi:2-haloacid dehalogenase
MFGIGAKPEVILFDVNETLLDTRALNPYFERLFGSASVRERWFKELEGLWLVTIATGEYQDFTKLAEAALEMTADKDRVDLSAKDRAELLERMTTLPPYPDVAPALTRLKEAGLRLAALTNGTLNAARVQLNHAELADYFEEIFSADEVERFKPAAEPYHMAAKRLDVKPKELRLVAAHAWDIAGAHAAGLKTGFVQRPRKVLNPLGPEPDLQGDDLLALAEQIVREDA